MCRGVIKSYFKKENLRLHVLRLAVQRFERTFIFEHKEKMIQIQ